MGNPNEVIAIALKDFTIDGIHYVAGSKYALTHEVIADLLKDGIVELVDAEPTPEVTPEVVEETPAPEVTPEEPVVPETPAETTPEVTPESEPAPVEPTPEVEAPAEEAKPWAGNHTVAN